jgi:hypothetical protein
VNIDEIGFQHLLYTITVFEKKYPIGDLAQLMNINPSRLYSYTGGQQYFPPDLIPVLYRATVEYDRLQGREHQGEMRIWNFLMDSTSLEAVRLDRSTDKDTIEKDLLDISRLTGKFIDLFQNYEKDDRFSELEKKDLSCLLSEIQREIEGVRVKVQVHG